jgi:hypothetical protein
LSATSAAIELRTSSRLACARPSSAADASMPRRVPPKTSISQLASNPACQLSTAPPGVSETLVERPSSDASSDGHRPPREALSEARAARSRASAASMSRLPASARPTRSTSSGSSKLLHQDCSADSSTGRGADDG